MTTSPSTKLSPERPKFDLGLFIVKKNNPVHLRARPFSYSAAVSSMSRE